MEAQGGAGSPDPNKDIQRLLKPSSSGELSKEPSHHPPGEEEGVILGHTSGLLHVSERRQPLSSVSSLEVHFDLLDLTELTDMSDQELAEVFADSDEENHNESPASAGAEVKKKEEEAGREEKTNTVYTLFQMIFWNNDSMASQCLVCTFHSLIHIWKLSD
ncbi:dysbindin domain-containing protein 1-like isoform X1 [Colossoma macropomum]|uniref:dysbindin domain-containing protein 1-like isoform X1 n=1 Tax=Colossoma macropomum TaxID=42526 RepID=UPI001864888E|nr:dysbindin domain-containing protein 1-like isoform X1 [Colossoma macropomum]